MLRLFFCVHFLFRNIRIIRQFFLSFVNEKVDSNRVEHSESGGGIKKSKKRVIMYLLSKCKGCLISVVW